MKMKNVLILGAAISCAPAISGAATLQQLFDGSCISGYGIEACNWQLEQDLSTVSVDYNHIVIEAEKIVNEFGRFASLHYEFTNGVLLVDSSNEIDLAFNYDLHIDSGAMAAYLGLVDPYFEQAPGNPGYPSDAGFMQVTASYFDPSDFTLAGELIAEIDPAFGTDNRSVWGEFDGYYTDLWVEKEIIVQSQGYEIGLGAMDQGVPLPASVVLLIGGLAGATFVRRRVATGSA
jgi:hypothetical protein